MAEIPGEPSQSEGAVDTAIRVLRQREADLAALRQALVATRAWIESWDLSGEGIDLLACPLSKIEDALATTAGTALLEELAHTKEVLDRERQEYGRMLNELARKDRVVEAARYVDRHSERPDHELRDALAAHDGEDQA